ncbi:MAG: 50S ribosomal protein L21 [Patescibacteria group bacterium]|nr:50S ribosomal protein L21 [Patescibacteria group bacterium]
MSFAVIRTGGKQYLVEEGRVITVEKIKGVKEGENAEFEVLLTDDGSTTEVGTPVLASKISGSVVAEGKDKKKIVVKYKPKSRYFKKRGHRQPFAKVKVGKI